MKGTKADELFGRYSARTGGPVRLVRISRCLTSMVVSRSQGPLSVRYLQRIFNNMNTSSMLSGWAR
jgi:hypothetical protein